VFEQFGDRRLTPRYVRIKPGNLENNILIRQLPQPAESIQVPVLESNTFIDISIRVQTNLIEIHGEPQDLEKIEGVLFIFFIVVCVDTF